jgi:hypothetical protein
MPDYSLNTNAQAIGIQMHGKRTVDPLSGHLVVTHNVGYPPTYFVAKITANYGLGLSTVIASLTETFGFATANSYQIDIRGAQSVLAGDYGVLILKDPVGVTS